MLDRKIGSLKIRVFRTGLRRANRLPQRYSVLGSTYSDQLSLILTVRAG